MPKIGSRITEQKLKDDSVTSAKIKDDELVNADINSAAAIAYSKLAADPRICRVKTGQYTGDGTTSQAITGIGFLPKMVLIGAHHTSGGNYYLQLKFTNVYSDLVWTVDAGGGGAFHGDRLISLDADGFTVDDAGIDTHPNADGQVYDYIAWG